MLSQDHHSYMPAGSGYCPLLSRKFQITDCNLICTFSVIMRHIILESNQNVAALNGHQKVKR